MFFKKAAVMLLVLPFLFISGCGKGKEGGTGGQAKPAAAIVAAPSGISTSSGNGEVTVKWAAVTGAASYTLYSSSFHPKY